MKTVKIKFRGKEVEIPQEDEAFFKEKIKAEEAATSSTKKDNK